MLIRKTISIDGTPTDMTSVTIGVNRTDPNAVVVASGTPMTHAGTGVYELTFTEPTPGLQYNVYYTIVNGTTSYSLSDVVSSTSVEVIDLPPITGDYLLDTYNSLVVERLRLARNGPKPSYSVHGHLIHWNEYLAGIDKRIMNLRVEMAQIAPWEIVTTQW